MRTPVLHAMTKQELISLLYEVVPHLFMPSQEMRLQKEIAYAMWHEQSMKIAERMKSHVDDYAGLAAFEKSIALWKKIMDDDVANTLFYETYVVPK